MRKKERKKRGKKKSTSPLKISGFATALPSFPTRISRPGLERGHVGLRAAVGQVSVAGAGNSTMSRGRRPRCPRLHAKALCARPAAGRQPRHRLAAIDECSTHSAGSRGNWQGRRKLRLLASGVESDCSFVKSRIKQKRGLKS